MSGKKRCGYHIKQDLERPCVLPVGHKDPSHRDARQYALMLEHIRSYQRTHPEKVRAWGDRSKVQRRQRRKPVQEAMNLLKATVGCAVCGLKDPRVLDFDHVDPATKCYNISHLVLRAPDVVTEDYLAVLCAELAKCVVLCANHHRVKTHLMREATVMA